MSASDLKAPKVNVAGPRTVSGGSDSAVSAPQAFAGFENVSGNDYSGASVDAGSMRAIQSGAAGGGTGVDTGVSGIFQASGPSGGGGVAGGLGGGGLGGTGTQGGGVVNCMDSAFVTRYLDFVKQRTKSRWQVPVGTATDSVVKLRFAIDTTGSATHVEYVEAATDDLGRSAVEALRAAALFPPMDHTNRCLAEWTLIGTFTANES